MNIDKKLDEILNMITAYWGELSDGDRVVKSVIGVGGKDEVKQEIKQLFQELIDEVFNKLSDDMYDDGRIYWGDATKESIEEHNGRNHADLAIATRYVHQHIENNLQRAKELLEKM